MKSVACWEKEYADVKDEYWNMICKRVDMLKRGEFDGKPEGKGYFPGERKLFKKSEKIRLKLLELKPEKYHYGNICTDYISIKNGRKHSQNGDNGYFICYNCKGLFKHRGYSKELKRNESKEGFSSCSEHKGRKSLGTLMLKKGDE